MESSSTSIRSQTDSTSDSPYGSSTAIFVQTKERRNSLSSQLLSEQELLETFSMYDKNQDGFIDAEDLSIVLLGLGQSNDNEKIKKILEMVDLDKDGLIDTEEFLNYMKHTTQAQQTGDEQIVEGLYEIFQRDHRGHISVHELRSCVHLMGETLSESEFADLLKEFDSDNDGFISFSDFQRLILL